MTFHFEYLTKKRDAELFLKPWLDGQFWRLGVDIETAGENGLDPYSSSIRLISLSDGVRNGIIDIWYAGVPTALLEILTFAGIRKYAHNAKFEWMNFFAQWKIEALHMWCTELLQQITRNGLDYSFSLKSTARQRLGIEMSKELQGSDWSKPELSYEQLIYSAFDSYVLPFIAEKQLADVEKLNLKNIVDLEMEMIPVWSRMQLRGLLFDASRVKSLDDEFQRDIDSLLSQIQSSLPLIPLPKKYFTPKGNLTGKAKQLYPSGYKHPETSDEFKTALKIAGVEVPTIIDKTTKKERESLSEETYGKIKHPCGLLLEEFYSKKTIHSTFVKPVLSEWVNKKTGRVHGHIKQCGARTGRISMESPNLMNLPREDNRYRYAVVPTPGYTWLSLDYSQIELRVMAEKTNAQQWIKLFKEGKDLHNSTIETIDGILGYHHEQMTRTLAKNINFGCGYDQTAAGFQAYLWKRMKVWFSIEDCKAFIAGYFATAPEIKTYHRRVHDETLRNWERGYSTRTLAGRIRFWEPKGIRKKTFINDDGTKREWTICGDAINMPIQGTVGDIIKLAMFRIDFAIRSRRQEDKIRLLLQIHDELGMEVHNSLDVVQVAKYFKKIMEDSATTLIKNVPILVEAKAGPSWGECKKLEL